LLAVQALRKYGKDFQVVADVIGSKTESHVRSFYANNERRYQLDKVIEQFNADNRDDMEENNEPVVVSSQPTSSSTSSSSQSKRIRTAAATAAAAAD
jgi:hypothetical protein